MTIIYASVKKSFAGRTYDAFIASRVLSGDLILSDLGVRPRSLQRWLNQSCWRICLTQLAYLVKKLWKQEQFTMETEQNGRLPFLDVEVYRKPDGSLGHSVYRKKTHTNRYLHADSNHHPSQKMSLIRTLLNRADHISDADSVDAERQTVIQALRQNGYANSQILTQNKPQEPNHGTTDTPTGFACLPYISNTTDRIAKLLRKNNIRVCFNTVHNVQQHLRPYKDLLPKLQTEGIYLVECDCGECYVGQTGRTIDCRLKEHKRQTIKGQHNLSAIAEHTYCNPSHNINFDQVQVLAKTQKYYPRLIKESIEILKRPNNFNRDDSYKLSPTWTKLIRDNTDTLPQNHRHCPNAANRVQ